MHLRMEFDSGVGPTYFTTWGGSGAKWKIPLVFFNPSLSHPPLRKWVIKKFYRLGIIKTGGCGHRHLHVVPHGAGDVLPHGVPDLMWVCGAIIVLLAEVPESHLPRQCFPVQPYQSCSYEECSKVRKITIVM